MATKKKKRLKVFKKVKKTKRRSKDPAVALIIGSVVIYLCLFLVAMWVKNCRNENDIETVSMQPTATFVPVKILSEEEYNALKRKMAVSAPKSLPKKVALHHLGGKKKMVQPVKTVVAVTSTPAGNSNAGNTMEQDQKAAAQGDAQAAKNLGNRYLYGQGVEKDYAQALKWHLEAAKQGVAESQFCVGFIYDAGLGVNQDYQAAMSWYTQSAKQGDSMAENALGYCYENGHGTKPDYKEAMSWYQKAVEHGNTTASLNIESLKELMDSATPVPSPSAR